MTELFNLEPLGEINRLMKMTPGRFKHFRERVMKPIRREDKYIYHCPKCNKVWEGEDYFDSFSQPCPEYKGEE